MSGSIGRFFVDYRFGFCYYYFMKRIDLQNVVWKEGKYYVAQCLNVDVSSFGRTKQSALKNLEEALALYFEDADMISLSKIEQPEIVRRELQYA